jgi:ADP-ribose pyrophosphatase
MSDPAQKRPPSYPEAQAIPEAKSDWQVDWPDYAPSEFTAKVVFENDGTKKPGGWADPPLPEGSERPQNPDGRTGISGRGLLGKWGANQAADPIVLRLTQDKPGVEAVLIKRRDNGAWAIPGGMVDAGEQVDDALARELLEETNLRLDFSSAALIYQGIVDDPRNTDNAWMETTAKLVVVDENESAKLQPKAGDDAADAQWVLLTEEVLQSLYANHGMLLRRALKAASSRGT